MKLLASLALIATCVVACSGGTAATQPPPPVTVPTTNSVAAGTNICALLTADQVAQITGQAISDSIPNNNFLTTNDARCEYTIQPTSPGDNNKVVIDVISPGGLKTDDQINQASETLVTTLRARM